jgi:hypothetical protein
LLKSILLHSVNLLDWRGNGGSHRALQLVELVGRAGFEVRRIEERATTKLERHLAGAWLFLRHRYPMRPTRRRLSNSGHAFVSYREALAEHEGPKLLLWEATGVGISAHIAKEQGFRVIAAPPNLEAAVAGHVDFYTGQSGGVALDGEVALLSKADAVFCISREEQWLLRLRGLAASYLRYYPPAQVESALLRVRQARRQGERTSFVMMGTANYNPSRLSMIEALKMLEELRRKIPFRLEVAGFGTELLREHIRHPDFVLHGTLDQAKLEALLTRARAALIYQIPSGGALTRIPELLVAGVPVLGNEDACRSAWDYDGVYPYADAEGLSRLMLRDPEMPPLPARPAEEEERFISCVQRLAGAG